MASRFALTPTSLPRRRVLIQLTGLCGLVALLGRPPVAVATPPATATVRFGRPETGSPFPPAADHDHSSHARDNLVPRTVVIARGGSVTYQVRGFHQVAIYRPDTQPEDISVPASGLINDPDGRVALGPPPPPPPNRALDWTTPPGTFAEPGRYLVICAVRAHFLEDEMYGTVIVQ